MPINSREWLAILWPSFVAACPLEAVVFAAFDPHDVTLFGRQFEIEGNAVYSVAFFAFWAITAATGVVTWSLSRTSEQVNRWQRRVPLNAPLPGNPRSDDYDGPEPPGPHPPGPYPPGPYPPVH